MRPLRVLSLVGLVAGCPLHLAAQKTAVVEFDHAAGTARLIVRNDARADTTVLGASPVVRLPRSVPVQIVVVNTNTALYRFARQTEQVAVPEFESVRSFMTKLRPYLPELRRAAISALGTRGPGDEATNAAARAAARELLTRNLRTGEQSLLKLDDVMHGSNGLRDNETSVVFALEQMRRGVPPEAASERLRTALALGGPCQTPGSLPEPMTDRLFAAVSDLLDTGGNLQLALAGLQFGGDPTWVQLRDSVRLMSERIQSAMSAVPGGRSVAARRAVERCGSLRSSSVSVRCAALAWAVACRGVFSSSARAPCGFNTTSSPARDPAISCRTKPTSDARSHSAGPS